MRMDVACMIWNAALIGLVSYVVFGLGHSAWWFLGVFVLFGSKSDEK